MKTDLRIFLHVILLVTGFCTAAAQGAESHNDVNVVILGDSNTWLGGDECDRPRGWNKWFRDLFAPATCRSYARSGATWTNTPRTVCNTEEDTDRLGDNNVIYNQICRLKEAAGDGRQAVPDLIMIAAGTNDAWFSKERPAAFTKTADEVFGSNKAAGGSAVRHTTDRPVYEVLTLAESVRYGCEMLAEAFPLARIVLLTPMQTTAVDNGDIRRTGDIIEECAHRMGLGVIRQDGDDFICREKELRRKRLTTDGTHTSEEGARRNGAKIVEGLKNLKIEKLKD